MKGSIGAGVLNLPFQNTVTGVIPSLIFLILGATTSYLTMWWLTDACIKTKTNNYGDLVKAVLGKPAAIVLNFVFIVGTFGSMAIYLIICSKTIPNMLIEFGLNKDIGDDWYTRALIITILTVVLFPLALKK